MKLALSACLSLIASVASVAAEERANIVFVIMDDVGIDQLRPFNPLAPDAAEVPVIESLCAQGIKFTNVWSMPECSPSRATFLTGRYPLRTNVVNISEATTPPHSQASPYEVTVPRALLVGAGYNCMYSGKLHLGDPTLNPGGYNYPFYLGFTQFSGTPLGSPGLLDPTIGSQIALPSAYDSDGLPFYSCGFPVDAKTSLPVTCSCGWVDEKGNPVWHDDVNALDCLNIGGIPLVNADGTPVMKGSAEAVARINWKNYDTYGNGYYRMPVVDIQGNPAKSMSYASGYVEHRDSATAIEFINAQKGSTQPWMCTLGLVTSHTPYQPPPRDSWPKGTNWPEGLPMACAPQSGIDHDGLGNPTSQSQREMMKLMNQNGDAQIGRVLVEGGLATWNPDGGITLTDPNTTVVIIGDNGSYFEAVRVPYNPKGAKGTVYQTGISVPLIVAGARVNAPGRSVDHMVNCVDLFQLFAELAGVDVHKVVPPTHHLDCKSMIGYLESPEAPAVRNFNFTQTSLAWQFPDTPGLVAPCFSDSVCMCSQGILFSQEKCEANGGTWMPEHADCCSVVEAQPTCGSTPSQILASTAAATFDGRYKLVMLESPDCASTQAGATEIAYEFYDLTTAPFHDVLPNGRGIDYPAANMLADDTSPDDCSYLRAANPEAYAACQALKAEMWNLLDQGEACPGDGNLDRLVNAEDIENLFDWWGNWPTVYDFNNDGLTDAEDLAAILSNWGECPS